MKYNFWTITFLILGGACIGFFGLVYWNLSATINQAQASEQVVSEHLTAIEQLFTKDSNVKQ